jgi:dCMP deaminase
MNLAKSLSDRSTCKRLKVGAVITSLDNTKIIAIGYNGSGRKSRHACIPTKAGSCGDNIHAEMNCMINKFDHKGPTNIYLTHSPCIVCADILINVGIRNLFYIQKYRDTKGIDKLKKHGVKVTKMIY